MSEPAPPLGTDSPFKGLMPYSEQDADWFFGRRTERELVIANLHAARLTLFYGVSGAGKSSVLRAGVVHGLSNQNAECLAHREPPDCIVVYFRSWMGDVRLRLGEEITARASDAVGRRLSLPGPSLAQVCAQASDAVGCRLLLVLDQFEEYFLYRPNDTAFDDALAQVINQPDLDTNVLISLREDSLSRLDRFKGKLPGLFGNYLRIKHLDRASAQSAIELPIARYNELLPAKAVKLEPGLTVAVLNAVTIGKVQVGDAGLGAIDANVHRVEAPYLQLVMTRLWRDAAARNVRTLAANDLERLGGAARIVQTHLVEVMSALTVEQQNLAADVFHYLVTPSGTKIAYSAADLAELTKHPEPAVSRLLTAFTSGEQRILRIADTAHGGAPRFEIFHDVLGRAILDWRRRHLELREQERREREGEARARAEWRTRVRRVAYTLVALGVAALALWAWSNNQKQRAQAKLSELARQEAEQAANQAKQALQQVDQAQRDALAKQDLLLKQVLECATSAPEASRLRAELAKAQQALQQAQKRAEDLQQKAQAARVVELNATSSKELGERIQQLDRQPQNDDFTRALREQSRNLDDKVKRVLQ